MIEEEIKQRGLYRNYALIELYIKKNENNESLFLHNYNFN